MAELEMGFLELRVVLQATINENTLPQSMRLERTLLFERVLCCAAIIIIGWWELIARNDQMNGHPPLITALFGVGVLVKEVYFFKLYFEIIIHSLEVAKKCTRRSFTQHTPNVSILHNWSKIPTPGNRLWYKPQSLFRFHQFYMQNLCMCIALCYFMTCFV